MEILDLVEEESDQQFIEFEEAYELYTRGRRLPVSNLRRSSISLSTPTMSSRATELINFVDRLSEKELQKFDKVYNMFALGRHRGIQARNEGPANSSAQLATTRMFFTRLATIEVANTHVFS